MAGVGESILSSWESATHLSVILDRIDLGSLEPRDRRKLESVLRDVEPQETLSNLEDMLNVCLDRTKSMKRSLRDIRGMME